MEKDTTNKRRTKAKPNAAQRDLITQTFYDPKTGLFDVKRIYERVKQKDDTITFDMVKRFSVGTYYLKQLYETFITKYINTNTLQSSSAFFISIFKAFRIHGAQLPKLLTR